MKNRIIQSFNLTHVILCIAVWLSCPSIDLKAQAPPTIDNSGSSESEDAAPANSELMVDETFDSGELSDAWHVNTGDWSVVDGTLVGKEIAEDKHAAAARRNVETENAVYQLHFRFAGEGKSFHFGFDPAPKTLDKKGHLFSVIITPSNWRILKHVDKNRPKEFPNEVLASETTKFERGEWYKLRVTIWQNHVIAVIEGKQTLNASDDTFAIKKPTLVFRCSGDGVEIDDIKVWRQLK